MAEELVGSVAEPAPGTVCGVGDSAVLNVDGKRYAVSRRCRHLRADLAKGHIDNDGCLVCPWHHAVYDPESGRMIVGPQAGFVRVPGLGTAFADADESRATSPRRGDRRHGNVYARSS